jgi:hypothetical protein
MCALSIPPSGIQASPLPCALLWYNSTVPLLISPQRGFSCEAFGQMAGVLVNELARPALFLNLPTRETKNSAWVPCSSGKIP